MNCAYENCHGEDELRVASYHESCYDEMLDSEERFWRSVLLSEGADDRDAYEPDDPKRYDLEERLS